MFLSLLLASALQAEAIGGYAGGCLKGGQPLPLSGPGYEVIRAKRLRYYGHPDLIHYLTQLASQTQQAGLPSLYIADLAMPHGGPFSSGHRSHQTGLDADIWFRMSDRPIGKGEQDSPAEWPLIDEPSYRMLPGRFGPQQLTLLKLAAQAREVERIFINPAIKAEVCRQAPYDDWVGKLRPWVGHFSHFHVRLRCPAGSPECVPQAPIPPGNGCGAELASWLKDKPQLPKVSVANRRLPPLPARCG
ncbi:penicillin-insensitive murein endopeptidase [Aeromonas simiae]|uniref:penicillin-insensitive murein endopeptidase n=1 Tax=Aeromonas simiae TaxID=218936 RepID=UPI00266B70A5|nr:penicillin-insensitive murein endopeptidase [Aeromonas simiae]MDO2947753.1 penicillin-insensitive murein endopeptidase [Aeromonas simiae]MDO2952373.1 penicillin-insensitive murein endopeptidase [Aeromonas simiae]MDO2954968.1 penicillin-insensitive murein endopeptidase [Aeromonas simiae]